MEIRKAKNEDINRIVEIYEISKKFMRDNGNDMQWIGNYPGFESIQEDIKNNNAYIIINNDIIVGVFTLIIGKDPSYDYLEGGNWLDDSLPYGTIHRIASSFMCKGILDEAVKYSLNIINNIRIDTHEVNIPMQKAIIKLGFTKCGTIYLKSDGTPRYVYQLMKGEN